MISHKMISNNKINYKEYHIDLNIILNEFYIRSSNKLDKDFFRLKYNNGDISHYFCNFIDKNYDYSENNYYIYKVKLDNYYLIEKLYVLCNKSTDLYFEYYKDDYIFEINKEKEIYYVIIYETEDFEFPKLSNEISKIDIYIEKLIVFNDILANDKTYIDDLEVYKFAKFQKIKIPEKYIYNIGSYGFSYILKRSDMEKINSYKVGWGKMPINDIKVL